MLAHLAAGHAHPVRFHLRGNEPRTFLARARARGQRARTDSCCAPRARACYVVSRAFFIVLMANFRERWISRARLRSRKFFITCAFGGSKVQYRIGGRAFARGFSLRACFRAVSLVDTAEGNVFIFFLPTFSICRYDA